MRNSPHWWPTSHQPSRELSLVSERDLASWPVADMGRRQYWVEHVRRRCALLDGVRPAESLGAEVFVEVGPGAGLTAAVEQSLQPAARCAVVTLTKDRPKPTRCSTAAGRLFTAGVDGHWAAVLAGWPPDGCHCRRMGLPGAVLVGAGGNYPHPRSRSAGRLAQRSAKAAPEEQRRQLVELVCAHAAAVLGHSDAP